MDDTKKEDEGKHTSFDALAAVLVIPLVFAYLGACTAIAVRVFCFLVKW